MSIWQDKPELVERLKVHYAEDGWSASKIARELGNGITRNSVIGKVTRLGLPLRGTDMPARVSRQYGKKPGGGMALPMVPGICASVSKVRTPPKAEFKAGADVPARVLEDGKFITVMTVGDKDCRYTYGDPGQPNFHFCGHPKKKGCFCEQHIPFCFSAPLPARRKDDHAA